MTERLGVCGEGSSFAKATLRRSKDPKDTKEETLGCRGKSFRQRKQRVLFVCSRAGTQTRGGWRGVPGSAGETAGAGAARGRQAAAHGSPTGCCGGFGLMASEDLTRTVTKPALHLRRVTWLPVEDQQGWAPVVPGTRQKQGDQLGSYCSATGWIWLSR